MIGTIGFSEYGSMQRRSHVRPAQLVLFLILSMGLTGCPDASLSSNTVSATSEGASAADPHERFSGEDRSRIAQSLAPPPTKASSEALEIWWREAEPGSLQPADVQRQIPTEALAEWLTDAYQRGIEAEQVQTALQTARWQGDADKDFHIADVDGDGRDEWLVTFYMFDSDFMPWGSPGDFWVIGNEGLEYRFFTPDRYFDEDYETQPEFWWGAPTVLTTQDLTGDEVPDIVLDRTICGAHTCTNAYYILGKQDDRLHNRVQLPESYDGVGTITMTYSEVQPFEDVTGDGLADFRIHGGSVGSAGSGIQRTRTEVWAWNGRAIALTDIQLDPTHYRYHLLWEANELFSAGELDQAARLYETVISDASLSNEGSFNSEREVYDDSRQFAAFRLTLLGLMEDDTQRAQRWSRWLATTYPGTRLTEAVTLLLSSAGNNSAGNNALRQGCANVTQFLTQFEVEESGWITASPTGTLRDMGYANPMLTATDVCPL